MNAILGMLELASQDPASPLHRRAAAHRLRIRQRPAGSHRRRAGHLQHRVWPADPGPEPCELAPLLQSVARAFAGMAEQKGLSYRVELDPLPRVLIDGPRLRQIVFNLLGNAIKFTERGEVSLQASLAGSAEQPQLHLLIRDSGVGIAPTSCPGCSTPSTAPTTPTSSPARVLASTSPACCAS